MDVEYTIVVQLRLNLNSSLLILYCESSRNTSTYLVDFWRCTGSYPHFNSTQLTSPHHSHHAQITWLKSSAVSPPSSGPPICDRFHSFIHSSMHACRPPVFPLIRPASLKQHPKNIMQTDPFLAFLSFQKDAAVYPLLSPTSSCKMRGARCKMYYYLSHPHLFHEPCNAMRFTLMRCCMFAFAVAWAARGWPMRVWDLEFGVDFGKVSRFLVRV